MTDSSCKTAIAAAVAGGYLLGRTRKAKTAIVIGTFLAGRRFPLSPAGLAAEGLRRLREHPQLDELRAQIKDELYMAASKAASSSADRGFSSLAGALRERGARRPQEEPGEAGEAEDREDSAEEDEQGPEDDARGGAESADDAEEPESPRHAPHRHDGPAGRKAAKHAAPPEKAAAAKKTAAKKAAARKPAAKKAAHKSAAAKSASRQGETARRKTTGRADSTTNRRGR
ncbi:hypothetical protein [Streptomyces sp. CA2R106]|uniref:hypothetical protein n=1 Tax=Streptomyces sp. CA2R106 TaxID=3120153 RepID=UPI00300BEC97